MNNHSLSREQVWGLLAAIAVCACGGAQQGAKRFAAEGLAPNSMRAEATNVDLTNTVLPGGQQGTSTEAGNSSVFLDRNGWSNLVTLTGDGFSATITYTWHDNYNGNTGLDTFQGQLSGTLTYQGLSGAVQGTFQGTVVPDPVTGVGLNYQSDVWHCDGDLSNLQIDVDYVAVDFTGVVGTTVPATATIRSVR